MDLGISLPAPEFNQTNLVKHWLEKYKNCDFLTLLKEHWREFVLVVFRPFDDPSKEERLANKCLFRPLEHFLCNGDPETVFKQLKESNKSSQRCGHVFKNGEPTYTCRECATDPTCIGLCMECFQTSVHKKHRYRMSTSGGRRYCDCGDPEAWKNAAFCGIHQPQHQDRVETMNPTEHLPDDVVDRASALFLATLQYTVELLTWTHCDSLPEGLQPDGDRLDYYVCMLFNDEIHTYEQVISTLQRSVNCSNKEAVDFATTVDREGRSSVKIGSYAECEKARNLIEAKAPIELLTVFQRHSTHRGNAGLKVQVMHSSVVAHQQFALRMIQWLQTVIAQSDGLCHLFCVLSMQQQECGMSLMEVLLLADTSLWKTARVQSHQLMMAGALKDQECKRMFSIIFTKHYTNLMQAFCLDDHDHDVSITSLSVQIFTVISLARLLIAEHNLLSVIINTFLQACEVKKNKDGKLNFDKTGFDRSGTYTFKRACFSLNDLTYTLTCKPEPGEWTDLLRHKFLEGFGSFLDLLKMIEGMDPVTRQTSQHLEFEPEWEGAFNLHLKLEDNIVLFLDWCASDRQVLIESYNKTVETFCTYNGIDKTKMDTVTVAGHVVMCINYEVSSQPVSIHLPVTRFLAGLHTYLGLQGLLLSSPDSCLRKADGAELLELPLRVQVMMAQSNANMWRRNGYALINQIFFYHNVKCRKEMFDRDIVMLQVGASLLDGNQFLIHLLYKFGLVAWTNEEYDVPSGQEDSLRQTILLAEDFLDLVIIILGERYVVGVGNVTKEDIVKREVIHQLCISPLSHSELAKALPEDPNHETGLEAVVRDVANFKKLTSSKSGQGGKGRYELKPEFYQHYNPYFYHYSKGDKSKSEECQVKRKKENNESLALPPPVPPMFTSHFQSVVNILQCDVMIYLIELILSRSTAVRSRSLSETQLERILHLIGIALHEQRRAIEHNNIQFDFLSKACGQTTESSKSNKDHRCVQELLESIMDSQYITHNSIRDLVTWTVKTLNEVRQMKNEPFTTTTVGQMPFSRDGLAAETARDGQAAETVRKKKVATAEKRRQKIMAQISAMQKSFIKDNTELLEHTSTDLFPRMDYDVDLSETSCSNTFPVGRNKTPSLQAAPITGTCILCQEEQEITLHGKTMVLTGFVQKSTVLSQTRSTALLQGADYDPLFMTSDLSTGSHTSSCGHMMHAACWQTFFDAILARERRHSLRFRHNICDFEKLEFMCPLCECICNTVIPVLPASVTGCTAESCQRGVHLGCREWLEGMYQTVLHSIKPTDHLTSAEDAKDIKYEPCPLITITRQTLGMVAQNFSADWKYAQDAGTSQLFSNETMEMLKKFARDSYSYGLGVAPDDNNARVPVMLWNTCAFSLQSMEQIMRNECKPIFGKISHRQSDCLKALVKVAAVHTQVICPKISKQHCIRLLSFLYHDPLLNLDNTLCLLDVDMFHFLVSLVMSLPTLHLDVASSSSTVLPSVVINDHHALHLVLAVHLVQILLTYDEENFCGMEVVRDYEGEALLIIYNKIHSLANIQKESPPLPWQLSVHVRRAMLPFLRSTALFFHYLTAAAALADLSVLESDVHPVTGEYENLCQYLGLGHCMSCMLDNHGKLMDDLITGWCKSSILREKLSASSHVVVQYPLKINKLVTLPEDYSELMNRVSTFTCPKSNGDDSRAPSMCLVCGRILCSQCYCCQTVFEEVKIGAATEHTYLCGTGTGIFLRVRECQILLLAGRTVKKLAGCFIPSPYIDDYGETDQGLRRGNPLHLCRDSYEHLQKLWMSHTIPETVVRYIESNANFLAIDWQHL